MIVFLRQSGKVPQSTQARPQQALQERHLDEARDEAVEACCDRGAHDGCASRSMPGFDECSFGPVQAMRSSRQETFECGDGVVTMDSMVRTYVM